MGSKYSIEEDVVQERNAFRWWSWRLGRGVPRFQRVQGRTHTSHSMRDRSLTLPSQFVEDEGDVVFFKNGRGLAQMKPVFADSASDSGIEIADKAA